jgi:hypothetical protein
MNRERIAGLALRTFPAAVRAVDGPELIATALDSSDGSSRRFTRELWDLARAGMRSRANATAQLGARRLVADGACISAVLWLAATATQVGHFQPDRWQLWPLLIALAFALLGHDRLAGLIGLVWIAVVSQHEPWGGVGHTVWGTPLPIIVALDGGALLLLTWMVVRPRRRRRDLHRLLWLAPVLLVGFAGTLGDGPYALAVLGTMLVALVWCAADPRLAIAVAFFITCFALQVVLLDLDDLGGALLAGLDFIYLMVGPAIIALACHRAQRLRRDAAR